jgi:zinc protease
VWVRVGSNWEPDHLRGWSHGIEHMIFKGTGRRAESDFAREVAEAGGTTNAGTGYETTSYHIIVPSQNLPTAFDILGDALFNATFEPASLDAERQVLVHENHMYDDVPYGFGITWRWGLELTYQRSPYRHPIGGRDEELLQVSREAILDFYRTAYRPENMTVVVVGDVDSDDILRRLATHFSGPESTAPLDLPAPPLENAQQDLRFQLQQGDLRMAYAKLIFPAISERDPDRPVLSVVRRILADGRSCRLYRKVQEERQLVSDITLLTETGPREGLVMVDLETETGKTVAAVQAVAEVLQQLREQPPTQDELARAKIRVERSFLFSSETVQGQSATLGYYDAMGDLDGAFEFPQRVARVTADDVTRFCQRVFRPDNLNILFYLPASDDVQAAGIPADAEGMRQLLTPYFTAAAGAGAALSSPVAAAGLVRSDQAASAVKREREQPALFNLTRLDAGLPVYWRVDHALPVFSLSLMATGGVCLEAPGQEGLAALTTKVQVKGTADADAEAIHQAVESLGASLSPGVDRDSGSLHLSGLTRHLDAAVEWLGRLSCQPSFPTLELDRERHLALEDLRSLEDDPFQVAAVALRQRLYGSHPYSYPLVGRSESLSRLTRDDLVRHHARTWVPENLAVVVSGDFDPTDLLDRLGAALAKLPATAAPDLPALTGDLLPAEVVRERLVRDFNQTVIFAAWPGPAHPDHDRAELMMLKELLNGQSGRLFEALRNRRSLCYNTGIQSTAGFGTGLIAAFVLTDPQSEQDALAALLDELRAVVDSPAQADEFQRARAKLTGNLLISTQANAIRVARCGRDILYGRDHNNLENLLTQIDACTPASVRDCAARYLDLERHIEILLGPRQEPGPNN